jgi:hypothetical protein
MNDMRPVIEHVCDADAYTDLCHIYEVTDVLHTFRPQRECITVEECNAGTQRHRSPNSCQRAGLV